MMTWENLQEDILEEFATRADRPTWKSMWNEGLSIRGDTYGKRCQRCGKAKSYLGYCGNVCRYNRPTPDRVCMHCKKPLTYYGYCSQACIFLATGRGFKHA